MNFKLKLLFLYLFIQINTCSAQNPFMNYCVINSCNLPCNEGDNEIIMINTGLSSVLVNSANINVRYGNVAPPITSFTNTSLVSNPIKTDELNLAAGCTPNLLIDATNTIVPPNSFILVVSNNICTNALNWTEICSMGPFYITYSIDPDWLAMGNFNNLVSIQRYFRTSITNTLGVTTTLDYDYTLPSIYTSNGAYATWTDVGGSAVTYGDNECRLTPTILPVVLKSFNGQAVESGNKLSWEVERENNNDFFEIKSSNDGVNYSTITQVNSVNSMSEYTYTYLDDFIQNDVKFYQLFLKDFDGNQSYLSELIVKRSFQNGINIYPNPSQGIVKIEISDQEKNKLNSFKIFNSTGKIIKVIENIDFSTFNFNAFQFDCLENGIYYFQFVFDDKIETQKVVLKI